MFDALANLLVFGMFGLHAESIIVAALHFFIMDITKIFVMLVIIIYMTGLLLTLLSPERVREYVQGKPNCAARTVAIVLGAVIPFCSYILSVPVYRLCRWGYSARGYFLVSDCLTHDQ